MSNERKKYEKPDYNEMSQEDFHRYLDKVAGQKTLAFLLAVPGVAEALVEELNNEVFDAWAEDQYGYTEEDCEEDCDEDCDED